MLAGFLLQITLAKILTLNKTAAVSLLLQPNDDINKNLPRTPHHMYNSRLKPIVGDETKKQANLIPASF